MLENLERNSVAKDVEIILRGCAPALSSKTCLFMFLGKVRVIVTIPVTSPTLQAD